MVPNPVLTGSFQTNITSYDRVLESYPSNASYITSSTNLLTICAQNTQVLERLNYTVLAMALAIVQYSIHHMAKYKVMNDNIKTVSLFAYMT